MLQDDCRTTNSRPGSMTMGASSSRRCRKTASSTSTPIRGGSDLAINGRNTDDPVRVCTTTSITSTSPRCRSSCSRPANASGSGSGGRTKGPVSPTPTVDFTHRFGAPGHELGVNLQFTRGKEDEAYFLNEESPSASEPTTRTSLPLRTRCRSAIDYTRPLPTGRLELGTKLQRRWIPVTYTVRRGVQSVIYPGLGEISDWDENIIRRIRESRPHHAAVHARGWRPAGGDTGLLRHPAPRTSTTRAATSTTISAYFRTRS